MADRRRAMAMAVVLAALSLAGCSSSARPAGATAVTTATTAAPSGSPSGSVGTTRYYLSLGDSYAAGYRPPVDGAPGATTRSGFVYLLRDRLAAAGHPLELVNLACSGATTASVLTVPGCPPGALGPGAQPYPGVTQARAAQDFLRAHPGRVDLVTVVLGGNDVHGCVQPGGAAARRDLACLTTALTTVRSDLTTLVRGLRAAGGDHPVLVGLTYPDVYLGLADPRRGSDPGLAASSLVLFRDELNPLLQGVYTSVGGRFVDVTRAAGAYDTGTGSGIDGTDGSFGPADVSPAAVRRICTLTYYCSLGDVHPTDQGHALIADAVTTTLGVR